MPLSAPAARKPVHTRQTTFRCYQREDGLWDVEGELHDSKSEEFEIRNERSWQPGEPIHHLFIRVTVGTDLVIRDLDVAMDAYPIGICPTAMRHMKSMVGCTMGRGWREAINRNLGRELGCTHLRELLFNMATAAFQGMERTRAANASPDEVPAYLGTCSAWDIAGPVVAREFPLHYRPRPTA
jgi:Protein of unknown function (DUF2889)